MAVQPIFTGEHNTVYFWAKIKEVGGELMLVPSHKDNAQYKIYYDYQRFPDITIEQQKIILSELRAES